MSEFIQFIITTFHAWGVNDDVSPTVGGVHKNSGDIASKPVKSTIVPFYWLTRLGGGEVHKTYGDIAFFSVKSTISQFYWLTRRACLIDIDRPRAARRRVRPGRLPPSAEHAPTPAHPPTCTLHTVDINSPRLSSFGKKRSTQGCTLLRLGKSHLRQHGLGFTECSGSSTVPADGGRLEIKRLVVGPQCSQSCLLEQGGYADRSAGKFLEHFDIIL